ncbi:POP5 [Acanthosepion pharaonis]|uniref:Ribonuclease P/MRP protein subunit POP5 n=1 Tax=Acanthosepion pharaonis TaxID=158019 RepID=A0A812B1B8_ACAPH|nr:POP5 [Sepia pharaonis]
MRFKKRYLLYELIPGHHHFEYNQIRSAVTNAIQEAHGDYGTAVLCHTLRVQVYNQETAIIMIRARFGQHHLVQSAVCFIKQIASKNVCFRALHIGGTIKSTERFLIKHHRQSLAPLLAHCKTKEERQKIQSAIRDSCSHEKKYIPSQKRGSFIADEIDEDDSDL